MSAPAIPAIFAPTGGVTWSTVDDGFHVASRDGEFVGSVDVTAAGIHIAFDGRSTALGRYPTLEAAQRAVVDVARGVTWPEPTRATRAVWSLATATGAVAVGLFVSAGALALF